MSGVNCFQGKKYGTNEEFDNNLDILKEAVMVAERLVKSNIEAISGSSGD